MYIIDNYAVHTYTVICIGSSVYTVCMAQEHPLQLGSSCVDNAKNDVDCFVQGCTPEHPIVKGSKSVSHKNNNRDGATCL